MPTKIKDTVNLANHGIIFKDHKALQSIYKQSGPLASSCEFQVHYWALVFRHQADDKSILDIAIPLVYFNYNQKVSGGRIDFEMKEVAELSEKLTPIAQMEAGKILSSPFLDTIQDIFQVPFTPLLSGLNTIHKHPGGSSHQNFSGTDLDTNPNDHGVVYPLASAAGDVPNFAGIMALDHGVNNTAHYEYRLVGGTLHKDIHYRQGRCAAITIKPIKQASAIETIMGCKVDSARKINEKSTDLSGEMYDQLEQAYRAMDYSPFLKAIVPENVVRAVSTHQPRAYGSGIQSTIQNLFGEPDQPLVPMPTFKDETEFASMKPKELIEYLMELDSFYLEREVKPEEYSEINYPTKGDIIDEILETQLNIISEQPMQRDDMVNTLVARGFAKSTLITKTNKQLEYLIGY